MLLPIIMICVCALLGGGTLIFLKLSAKHKKSKNKDKEELAQITANEFVNVKDIRGNFLYMITASINWGAALCWTTLGCLTAINSWRWIIVRF